MSTWAPSCECEMGRREGGREGQGSARSQRKIIERQAGKKLWDRGGGGGGRKREEERGREPFTRAVTGEARSAHGGSVVSSAVLRPHSLARTMGFHSPASDGKPSSSHPSLSCLLSASRVACREPHRRTSPPLVHRGVCPLRADKTRASGRAGAPQRGRSEEEKETCGRKKKEKKRGGRGGDDEGECMEAPGEGVPQAARAARGLPDRDGEGQAVGWSGGRRHPRDMHSGTHRERKRPKHTPRAPRKTLRQARSLSDHI